MNKNNFSNFKADGKTHEVNNIKNITEITRNISILVGMLLGLTDLVESSEDMRAISSLSVGLKKKNLELYFSESLKSV